jgi:hypothetical protein
MVWQFGQEMPCAPPADCRDSVSEKTTVGESESTLTARSPGGAVASREVAHMRQTLDPGLFPAPHLGQVIII